MINPVASKLKGKLVLKTGQKLDVLEDPDVRFSPTSFTETTIRRWEGTNRNLYFVQGDNVAYLELEQSE